MKQLLHFPANWATRNSGSRIAAVDLEFAASPRKFPRRGKLICLIAAILCMFVGWLLVTSRAELRQLEQEKSQFEHRSIRQRPTPETAGEYRDQEALAAEVREANEVVRKLSTRWDKLLKVVSETLPQGVTLLSMEPDLGRNELRITAEAKDVHTMAAYLRRLQGASELRQPYISNHQTDGQALQRPIRFQVMARWVPTL